MNKINHQNISVSKTNIIASIARYHRKTLPKKRHESWQNLISKEDKTLEKITNKSIRDIRVGEKMSKKKKLKS